MKITRLLALSSLFFAVLPLRAAVDEAPFQELKTFDFQNRKPVEAINRMIRTADAATQADIEAKLLAVLDDPATTFAAQQEIAKMLWKIGTVRAVPSLAKWLPDEKLNDVARYALERIADPAAGKALREALPVAKGKSLIGIINSLGERRDREALPTLKSLATADDAEIANAAIVALGKIGNCDAITALRALPNKSLLVYQSLLAAEQLKKDQCGIAAQDILRLVLKDADLPLPARLAATYRLLSGNPILILESLRSEDADLRALAARFVRDSTINLSLLVGEVEKLPTPGQTLLLGALADRREKTLLPVLMRAATAPDAEIRLAALRAFAPLEGNAEAALLLAKTIARGASKAEKDAARASLAALRGAAVDEAIIAALPAAELDVRRELVYALGQRYHKSAKPLLFKIATDPVSNAQDSALNALGEVSGPEDYPAIVKLLLETQNNALRGPAENLVIRVARLVPGEAERTGALIAGLNGAPVETRISVLKVLGALGGAAALGALRADLSNADTKIQDATMRALATTPDPDAMKDLLEIARNAPGKVHQVLALRGYLKLAETAAQQRGARPEEIYEPALKVATEPQEKKTIISGLSRFNIPGALALITPLLDDEAVRGEAALAALGIARTIAAKNPQEARAALEKIVAVVKDENVLKQANEVLQKLRAAT